MLLIAHLLIGDKEKLPFLIFHEIGFALLVSLVVWALFEAQLSHEAEATWDQRIERVAKNVFQAMLRKDLPKALLDEANNLVLNSSLVRNSFAVTYTLSDAEFDLDPHTRAPCVLVDALMGFTMTNIGTDDYCWGAKLLLPNPIHPEMKRFVAVRELTVTKGGEGVSLDMTAAKAKFEQDLHNNSNTSVPFSAGDVMLKPGETCEFSASYVMAKEVEDTELLGTLYPADGLRVTIFDANPDSGRIIMARSVHRQPVEVVSGGYDGSNVARIFRIPGYLLPHQGVLIWWKHKVPAGAVRDAAETHPAPPEAAAQR